MYGTEGKALLKTMACQRVFTKQFATLRGYNKSATLITNLTTRSRKLHTTVIYNTGCHIKDQRHLLSNPLLPLARISSKGWPFCATKQRHVRFKSVSASLDSTDNRPGTATLSHSTEQNDHDAVLSEFKTIKQLDSPLTTENCQAVLEAYGKLKMEKKTMDNMMGVYVEMLSQGVHPTSEIYAIIIRSLCDRNEEVNRATDVIRREMETNTYVREGGARLHTLSVDNMSKSRTSLSALESENNLHWAMSIFEQAVSENNMDAFDVDLYNKLLHGVSYTGNTQDGLFIYEQLENNKVQPNSVTFAMLLSLFGKAGDLQAVEECFKEYKTVYGDSDDSRGRRYVYKTLVSAHVNAGDLKGALQLVENILPNKGVPVSITYYNKILQGAYMEKNVQLISQTVNELESNGKLPDPDALTYGILLSAHSRARNMNRAHEAYEKVMSMNLDRQYSHLNAYITACVDENELGRSMDTIRRMSAHGMSPHINQCCKVVNGILDVGDMRGAANAVKEMIQLQSKKQRIEAGSPLVTLCMDVIQRTDNLVDALDIIGVLKLYSIQLDKQGSETILKLYDQTKADPAKWNEFVDYCTERSYYILCSAAFKRPSGIDQFTTTVFKLLKDMHDLGIQNSPSWHQQVGLRMHRFGAMEDKDRWEKTVGNYYTDLQNEVTQPLETTTLVTLAATPAATTTYSTNSDIAEQRTGEALLLAQSGEFDKALVLMKEKIIEQGLVPTPGMVLTMIWVAKDSKLFEKANDIYNMVVGPYKQLSNGPRRKALQTLNDTMMRIHSYNKNVDATKMYYGKLRSHGMYPSSDGYAAFLSCVSNGTTTTMDEPVDVMKIFSEAKKHNVRPTLYLYNVVIAKLGKYRKMDQALTLLNEMQEYGLQPDSVTYGSVVSTCLRCGSEVQAVRYFDEMTRMANHQPLIGAYNAMIQYYVRERGDRQNALAYFEKLKRTTLVPSIHTYRLLIEAYANTPDHDMGAACSILDDMKNQYGLTPVAGHYATLIKSYGCIHLDVASAEAIFDKMTRAGVESKESVYRALLDTYISNNNISKAETLYKTMLDAKIRSSSYIETLFIKGYGENGNVEKAEQVFNNMLDREQSIMDGYGVVREPNAYEAIVKVYMNHGQVDKANQVRDRMKQFGFPIKVMDGVSLLIEQGQQKTSVV